MALPTPGGKSEHLFADLNILFDKSNPKLTAECVKLAVSLGFDSLAINTEILGDGEIPETTTAAEEKAATGGKKRPKKKLTEIPPPFNVDSLRVDQSHLNSIGKKLRLYTRLTLGMDDTSLVHCVLNNPIVSQYDILCFSPKTEEMFNVLVKKPEINMISVDLTKKCAWISKKNLVQKAVENGTAFEITYSQALSDSSTRRDVFTNARDIVRATKGKGIIISSRAERPIEIRGPYDVANMGVLFGLTAEQGMRAISGNAKRLLLYAESKKTIKGVINVQKCASICENSVLQNLLKIPEFRAECKILDQNSEKKESISEEIMQPPIKKKRKR